MVLLEVRRARKMPVDSSTFVNYTREFSILFLGESAHTVHIMLGVARYHLRVSRGAEFVSGYSV